jgi:hypothetical protein
VVFPIVSRRQRIVPEFSAKCFFTSLIVRERKEEEENNKKQFKQEKHKAQIVPAGMRTNPFLRSSSLVVLFFYFYFFFSVVFVPIQVENESIFPALLRSRPKMRRSPKTPSEKEKKKATTELPRIFLFYFRSGRGEKEE